MLYFDFIGMVDCCKRLHYVYVCYRQRLPTKVQNRTIIEGNLNHGREKILIGESTSVKWLDSCAPNLIDVCKRTI